MYKMLFILLTITQYYSRETIHLTVLTRHGARYPETHTDPSLKSQLTNNGQRQLYLLGKYIRKTYENFFPKKYTYSDNRVLASGTDRTIVSA